MKNRREEITHNRRRVDGTQISFGGAINPAIQAGLTRSNPTMTIARRLSNSFLARLQRNYGFSRRPGPPITP